MCSGLPIAVARKTRGKNLSQIKLANFNNIGKVIDPPLPPQEIENGLKQTLARLLGWNYLRDRFDFLITDADGRLLVSTDPTKSEDVTHSVVSVTTSSGEVLAALPTRRAFTILNNGSVVVYFQLGTPAATDTSMPLNPGISWSDTLYIGQVTAIVSSGTCELRVLENI